MSDLKKTKTPNPGQMMDVYTWDEKRENLIVKDTIDLEEVMKERARGVSVYEMIERYGDPELIPGFGLDTVKSDGTLSNGADLDLTNIPEFGTEILNAQLAQAEQKIAAAKAAQEAAAKAAAEAKAAADAAAKAKEEFIAKKMAEEGGQK